MGQFEEAAEDLNVSIARDPQNADSYRLRGYCWHRLGKMDLAIADYDEVLRRDSNDFRLYSLRGRAWSERGDLARALRDLSESIRKSPQFGLAHLERAYVWNASREYDRAQRSHDRSSKRPGASPRRRGGTVVDSGDLSGENVPNGQQAIENARQVLTAPKDSRPPDDRTARVGSILMAVAYTEAGDFEAALAWYQRAVRAYKRGTVSSANLFPLDEQAWFDKIQRSIESRHAYTETDADRSIGLMKGLRLLSSVTEVPPPINITITQ